MQGECEYIWDDGAVALEQRGMFLTAKRNVSSTHKWGIHGTHERARQTRDNLFVLLMHIDLKNLLGSIVVRLGEGMKDVNTR